MKIFKFGNDYVNERSLQNKENELDNVRNSNATSSPHDRAEGNGGAKEPTAQTTSKPGRKKKEAKEEKTETEE